MQIFINTLLILFCLAVLYVLSSLFVYRLPSRKKVEVFESEVVFNYVDIRFTARELFETTVLSNGVVSLAVGAQRFYLTREDKAKLWQVSPRELSKNGCSLKIKLKAQPLLFGGYGLGVIEEIITINKTPIITK